MNTPVSGLRFKFADLVENIFGDAAYKAARSIGEPCDMDCRCVILAVKQGGAAVSGNGVSVVIDNMAVIYGWQGFHRKRM